MKPLLFLTLFASCNPQPNVAFTIGGIIIVISLAGVVMYGLFGHKLHKSHKSHCRHEFIKVFPGVDQCTNCGIEFWSGTNQEAK